MDRSKPDTERTPQPPPPSREPMPTLPDGVPLPSPALYDDDEKTDVSDRSSWGDGPNSQRTSSPDSRNAQTIPAPPMFVPEEGDEGGGSSR